MEILLQANLSFSGEGHFPVLDPFSLEWILLDYIGIDMK